LLDDDERTIKSGGLLFLLGLQVFGAIVFILQELPEFRQVVLAPGQQLRGHSLRSWDGRCSFWDANCLLVQAIACPNSSTAPEPFAVSRFSFSGAPQFIFGSALFSVVVFRQVPELDREADMFLVVERGIIFVACLFALFCSSLEVERQP
jgi:hypothetical protein